MWRGGPGRILTPFDNSVSLETGAPHHSSPFQSLEKLWIQDASLEIARVSAVRKHNSISGLRVLGFEMPKNEGFDINYEEDLVIARKIALDNEIGI
jgi:CMP-N-acetylneuraminic acid synthetase